MLQVAKKHNAINEYGSVVALSYIAAQRTMFGYNDMADAKALLESIARSFGYIYGREHHVRINTISQSPTLTTAGSGVKGMESLMDFANRMSPLGNATADECANYCVVMFSDLTQGYNAESLPRRRFLQYGYEPPCYGPVREGIRQIPQSRRNNPIRLVNSGLSKATIQGNPFVGLPFFITFT